MFVHSPFSSEINEWEHWPPPTVLLVRIPKRLLTFGEVRTKRILNTVFN